MHLGISQLKLPIWDGGKKQQGTVLLRVEIVKHEAVAETTEESESEAQPSAF